MADRNCLGSQKIALDCQAARLRRRQALEDTPMAHLGTRVDASCQGCSLRQAEELTALLQEQNRLLYDILGAVTSLTAAQLAAGQARRM